MKKYVIIVILYNIFPSFTNNYDFPTPYKFPELNFFPPMPVAPNNIVTKEGAELGRYLFYDKILSREQDISCASCHKQEYAFSDAPNALSKGNKGTFTTRNTMPLFNLAWYKAFFWDGRASSIEQQIFHPVRNPHEMNLIWKDAAKRVRNNTFYRKKFQIAFPGEPIDSVRISKAIAQFLRTLISNNSKYDRVLAGKDYFTADEYAGWSLVNDMTKGDCLHCHPTDANALGTTGDFSNNGLENITNIYSYNDKGLGAITKNEKDYGKFKIPSLRNVSLTAPYMHDGRFATLEEVIDFYSEGVNKSINVDSKMRTVHQGGAKLTEKEKEQIIAFLMTLTDSSFISNPEFNNPFK